MGRESSPEAKRISLTYHSWFSRPGTNAPVSYPAKLFIARGNKVKGIINKGGPGVTI